MTLKTVMLTFAAAGLAASLYKQFQQSRSTSTGFDMPRRQESADATSLHDLPTGGAASPNTAERMQDENLAGSPVGAGTPMADSPAGKDLFGSSSQQGETPAGTGLPDLTRGA